MELLQMRFAGRIASLLDILANVIGTATGVALAAPAEKTSAIVVDQIRRTGLFATRAKYMLALLLGTILFAAWYPFDITLDVSTLGERTRPVRFDPWLKPAASELWSQAARFGLMAATMVFCLPKLARSAAAAIVVTVVFAAVVDLGQLAMGSRPIGLAAFASQTAAVLAGAAVALVVLLVRGTP
jgi:hypothetical protein